ncbi:MAG: Calx-beta domain-containing protein [Actinomycetota bacterium]
MRLSHIAARTGAIVILLALQATPVAASSGCVQTVDPTLGPGCLMSDGLFQIAADAGTDLVVHEADDITEPDSADSVVPSDPFCVPNPNTDNHMLVIYSYPSDVASQYGSRLSSIRSMVRESNGRLNREANAFGARADYKVRCDGAGQVTVVEVMLPTPSYADSFNSVVTDLRALGYNQTYRKYWVWHEGSAGGASGTGHLYTDDRRTVDNANNAGPGTTSTFAVQWGAVAGFSSRTWMHENAHNLGAVADAAPGSSSYGHCWDGLDVMCYADGGTPAYSGGSCTDFEHFDCGNDTYFNPDPDPSSWLANNWNLAWSQNRFYRMRPTTGWQTSSSTVPEAAGSVDIPLERRGIVDVPFTIQVQTQPGTATAGDYTPIDQAVTFASGERTKTVSVLVNTDGDSEGPEYFTVVATSGADGEVTQGVHTVNLTDSEAGPPRVRFGSQDFSVTEDAGTVAVLVQRIGDNSGTASVDLLSGSPEDIQPTTRTVTFAPGETVATATLDVINDAIGESAETVTIGLDSPVGATLTGPSSIEITIEASDIQPDAMISNSSGGAYLGNGTYNLTTIGQTKLQRGRANERRSFWVLVQNDGPEAATFTIRRSVAAPGTKLYAFDQFTGANITWPLRSGYQITLDPGKSRKIRINTWVTGSVPSGARRTFWISGNWSGDQWKPDKVEGIIERR